MTTHIPVRRGAMAAGLAGLMVLGSGAAEPAKADLLDEIMESGTLTAATEARFPPFEYIENGEIVGFSVDLLAEIAPDLEGVTIERQDVPWQGILPGLGSGRFDYVITSVTATCERSQEYTLSFPIAEATYTVMYRAGDETIQEPSDLRGKVVGSQAGSAQLQGLQAFNEELESDYGEGVAGMEEYVDFSEAYADLATGRLDAVFQSLPNLLYAAQQRPDRFEVLTPAFGDPTYFTWAGRNDEESARLNEFFSERLEALHADGTMAELHEKWFGYAMEIPDDGLPDMCD